MLYRILAILLLSASTVFAQDFTSVFAETKPSPQPFAPKSISPLDYAVRICVRDGTGKPSYGSGVIVPEGVLTCAHVVPRGGLTVTVEYKGEEASATLKAANTDKDVALLVVAWVKQPPQAKVATVAASVRDRVSSAGRDYVGDLDLKDHIVIATYRNGLFDYTNPPKPGRSGSGIFNSANELVGLVRAFSDVTTTLGTTRHGIAADLSAIKSVLDVPQTPQEKRRAKRRATVFTGESVFGDKWCANCLRIKREWGDGNEEIELVYSREVAPGGFQGDDQYPAFRFHDTKNALRYPANEDRSYRMPSSLQDLIGVIDRAGGSYAEE